MTFLGAGVNFQYFVPRESDYLKPKVQDAASRQNREQTPVLEGVVDGEITRF